MIRIALINIVLHGIKASHIELVNTLSNKYGGEKEYKSSWQIRLSKEASIKNDISDRLTLGTTKTELLFVEKYTGCLKLVKNTG